MLVQHHGEAHRGAKFPDSAFLVLKRASAARRVASISLFFCTCTSIVMYPPATHHAGPGSRLEVDAPASDPLAAPTLRPLSPPREVKRQRTLSASQAPHGDGGAHQGGQDRDHEPDKHGEGGGEADGGKDGDEDEEKEEEEEDGSDEQESEEEYGSDYSVGSVTPPPRYILHPGGPAARKTYSTPEIWRRIVSASDQATLGVMLRLERAVSESVAAVLFHTVHMSVVQKMSRANVSVIALCIR